MLIKDVMRKAVTISPEATRKEIYELACKHPDNGLFIVADKSGLFLGDIHENDLFFMLLPDDLYEDIGVELAFDIEKKFFAKTAGELMHKHDVSCHPDDDILTVGLSFIREGVTAMPVLNNWGVVQGYVTQGMLLRHLDSP